METKQILKWLGLPNGTVINRKLPKTQIYPHIKKTSDKQFLQNEIQTIYLLASIKQDNTNIPEYENEKELYQEIQFLYVSTKKCGNAEKVYKLLAGLIPYPLAVIVEEQQEFVIIAGRFEKLSSGFLKLQRTYPSPIYKTVDATQILSNLAIMELPRQNLKVFYDGFRDKLATESAKRQYGDGIDEVSGDIKDKLDELTSQINLLSTRIKKERQLNRKIDMQMQLKKVKDELHNLINQ